MPMASAYRPASSSHQDMSLVQQMTGRWRTSDLPPDWDKFIRPAILQRDPFCLWGSLRDDRTGHEYVCGEYSTEVDHIGDADNHEPENLRGLCSVHHAIRTGRQGAAARHALRPQRLRPAEQHPGFVRAFDIIDAESLQRALALLNMQESTVEGRLVIIKAAKDNGMAYLLPTNWNDDGTLK